MDGRIAHIQVAKGMAIILVAFNHSDLAAMLPTVNDALRTFRVPLFFFLAGVFFSIRESWWPFLLRKADALLKPYVVTALLYLAFCYWRGPVNVAWQLKAIGYGNGYWLALAPLWFLPHLFALYLAAYGVCRCGRWWQRPHWLRWLAVAVMLTLGVIGLERWWLVEVELFGWRKVLPGLPWSSDLLLLSGAFFLSGNLLQAQVVAISFRPRTAVVTAALFVLLAGFSGVKVDFNQRLLELPLQALSCACCGLFLILQLALLVTVHLPRASRALRLAGDASLFILLFHSPVNRLMLGWQGGQADLPLQLAAFVCSVLLPLLLWRLAGHSLLLRLLYLPVVAKQPRAAPSPVGLPVA